MITILEAIEEVNFRRILGGDRGASIERTILRGQGSFDCGFADHEAVAAALLGIECTPETAPTPP